MSSTDKTAESVEMPLSVKAYNFYDNRVFPRVNSIRGTTLLNNALRKIGLESIVQDEGDGFRLEVISRSPVFSDKEDLKYVFMESEYLKEFLDSSMDADVFCDVGGYHGFYSLVSNSEKSIVFEADPENADHLKDNIALNPDRYLELVEKAVWSSKASVEFEAEASGTSHVSDKGIQREAVTVDSFFDNREDPDVVKVDVEGAEGHIFEGAENVLERSKPALFIEWHLKGRVQSYGYEIEELESMLKNLGYNKVFEKSRGSEIHSIYKHKGCPDCRQERVLEKKGYSSIVGKIWKCRNCGSGWSDFEL